MLRRGQEGKILIILKNMCLREQKYFKRCMEAYMQRGVSYLNDRVLTKTVARVCLGTDNSI